MLNLGGATLEISQQTRANGETFIAEAKCFWKNSEIFLVCRKQKQKKLFPRQMFRVHANGEISREIMFPLETGLTNPEKLQM